MNLFILFVMSILIDHLSISSPVFKDHETIPKAYSCEGANVNPPLNIESIPEGTKSLAIIMDDPDAANGTFVHWIAWNIPPMKMIEKNTQPGITGKNGAGENKYTGPCPPTRVHRYYFKLYALNAFIDLPVTAGKETLEEAIKEHILAKAELVGYYQKH
jgi:Raf kinase inhibitor-like YbhB/YbcL family protein